MKLLLLLVALCSVVTPLQGHPHLRRLAAKKICADQTFSKKRGYRNFKVNRYRSRIVTHWTGITAGYCNEVTDRKLNFPAHNHDVCAKLGTHWYDVRVPEVIWPLVKMQENVKRNTKCIDASIVGPTRPNPIVITWVP